MCVALVNEARGAEAQQVVEGAWGPPAQRQIGPRLSTGLSGWVGGEASFRVGGRAAPVL